MRSTLTTVDQALGTAKFTVLAAAVDRVIEDQETLRERACLDDQIETIDFDELAEEYGTTRSTLQKQIESVLGGTPAFRCGKKWVIRKQTFLEFLRRREKGSGQDAA